jgi:hypothetical protein
MENVFTAFKPFYLLSKLIGTFPMTFQGQAKNGNFKTKLFDAVYSIISCCAIFFMIYMKFSSDNLVRSESMIVYIIWSYSIVFELLTLLIQLWFQIYHRHEIELFLKLLHEFDNEVKALGLQVNIKTHKRVAFIAAFLVVGINTLIGIIMPIIYFQTSLIILFNWIVAISYGYKNVFKLFYSFQLFLANFAIQDRMKLMNDFLR